jgi:YHS domain-containing protein
LVDLTPILTWCFVDAGKVASVAGLTSGIDLALRVVERYFGRATAYNTAYSLEYQGLGWRDPDANHAYAKRRHSTALHPLCPVCDMDVEKATASLSTWRGRRYYFCMPEHRHAFDARPSQYLQASASGA